MAVRQAFDGVQREEEAVADLAVREPLGDQPQHFQFAPARGRTVTIGLSVGAF